jgi:hypothetical protein
VQQTVRTTYQLQLRLAGPQLLLLPVVEVVVLHLLQRQLQHHIPQARP